MKNRLILYSAIFFLASCGGKDKNSERDNLEAESNFKYLSMEDSDFNKNLPAGAVKLYRLKNKNGLEMAVINFGARVVGLYVPDRKVNFEDVVLGYDTLDEYIDTPSGHLSALRGRYGTGIAD